MNVIIIMNKRAGTVFRAFRRTSPKAVREAFQEAGLDPDIRLISPSNLPNAVRQAVKERPDTIVVAGGDGTINTAAAIIGGSDIPMAVIPQGSFNLFARHLGLPFKVAATAHLVAQGYSKLLDMGVVNDRPFMLFSSIGAHPVYVRERKLLQHRKGWWKPFAMLWAVSKSILRFPQLTLHLEVDGEKKTHRTASLIAATSPGALNFLYIVEDGQRFLTDKTIYLYLGRQSSRLGMLRSFVTILFSRATLDKYFEMHTVQSFSVDTGKKGRHLLTALDGELTRLRLPLQYGLLPAHLRVVLPQPE